MHCLPPNFCRLLEAFIPTIHSGSKFLLWWSSRTSPHLSPSANLFSQLCADPTWTSVSLRGFHKPTLLIHWCVADFRKVWEDAYYLEFWGLGRPILFTDYRIQKHLMSIIGHFPPLMFFGYLAVANCSLANFSNRCQACGSAPLPSPHPVQPRQLGELEVWGSSMVVSKESFKVVHFKTINLQTNWSSRKDPCGLEFLLLLSRLPFPNDSLCCFTEK